MTPAVTESIQRHIPSHSMDSSLGTLNRLPVEVLFETLSFLTGVRYEVAHSFIPILPIRMTCRKLQEVFLEFVARSCAGWTGKETLSGLGDGAVDTVLRFLCGSPQVMSRISYDRDQGPLPQVAAGGKIAIVSPDQRNVEILDLVTEKKREILQQDVDHRISFLSTFPATGLLAIIKHHVTDEADASVVLLSLHTDQTWERVGFCDSTWVPVELVFIAMEKIAIGYQCGSLCVLDVGRSLTQLFSLDFERGNITALHPFGSGSQIVAGYGDGSVLLWNLETNRLEECIRQQKTSVLYLQTLADRFVVVGHKDGVLTITDLMAKRRESYQSVNASCMALLSDKILLFGTGSGCVYKLTFIDGPEYDTPYQWDLLSHEPRSVVTGIYFFSDRKEVVISYENGEIYIWDGQAAKPIYALCRTPGPTSPGPSVYLIQELPCGQFMTVEDDAMTIWAPNSLPDELSFRVIQDGKFSWQAVNALPLFVWREFMQLVDPYPLEESRPYGAPILLDGESMIQAYQTYLQSVYPCMSAKREVAIQEHREEARKNSSTDL